MPFLGWWLRLPAAFLLVIADRDNDLAEQPQSPPHNIRMALRNRVERPGKENLAIYHLII